MQSSRLPLLAAAFVLFVGVATSRADEPVGSFHRSFTVSGPVHLHVETGAGAIHVTGAPGSAVTVDGTIYQSEWLFGGADPGAAHRLEANPPVQQAGNSISAGGDPDRDDHLWIAYVVTTPPNTDLEAQSGSGAIEIAGLTGTADLRAGSGHIRVADLGGSLTAQTGSGGIAFDRVSGDARVHAGSGSIEGNEVGGFFSASTGSGHIRVRQLDKGGEVQTSSGGMDLDQVTGNLSAHASSGSMDIGGNLNGDHRWDLTASSGSVHLSLPADTAAQVRLHTGSGGISVAHPMRTQTSLGRHSWEGEMGQGAATASLTVNTSSGSIHIR